MSPTEIEVLDCLPSTAREVAKTLHLSTEETYTALVALETKRLARVVVSYPERHRAGVANWEPM